MDLVRGKVVVHVGSPSALNITSVADGVPPDLRGWLACQPVGKLVAIVTRAKAGVQKHAEDLDSRVRGNDGPGHRRTFSTGCYLARPRVGNQTPAQVLSLGALSLTRLPRDLRSLRPGQLRFGRLMRRRGRCAFTTHDPDGSLSAVVSPAFECLAAPAVC